jgi:hypothetical protein
VHQSDGRTPHRSANSTRLVEGFAFRDTGVRAGIVSEYMKKVAEVDQSAFV